MRQKDSNNNIILKKTDLDLSNVNAIKINPEEGQNLVSGSHDEMMLALQKKGIEYVLLTDKVRCFFIGKKSSLFSKIT